MAAFRLITFKSYITCTYLSNRCSLYGRLTVFAAYSFLALFWWDGSASAVSSI
jgi:hypothetical protein